MSVEIFEQHRALLTGVAYRMLGSVCDAEDVVQEAWLRWDRVEHGEVRDPRAYLLAVTTRLAIDRLRREAARRETYIGPWLPEPVLTGPDAAARVELADSLAIALLVVLETLSPLERAVYVLHEAFGIPHSEIAAMLGRNQAAVRQLAHRARQHVRQRRPRFQSDRAARAQITTRFLVACEEGDLGALMDLLAPDVVFIGDGGGIGPAPRDPLYGVERIATFLLGLRRTSSAARASARIAEVNGGPGIVITTGHRVLAVFTLDIHDAHVQSIHAIANPDKLGSLHPN